MSFDEEPEGDPHGECAAEISRLTAALREVRKLAGERDGLADICRVIDALHPDRGTPNWCPICSPKGLGYCRCEIACNE